MGNSWIIRSCAEGGNIRMPSWGIYPGKRPLKMDTTDSQTRHSSPLHREDDGVGRRCSGMTHDTGREDGLSFC